MGLLKNIKIAPVLGLFLLHKRNFSSKLKKIRLYRKLCKQVINNGLALRSFSEVGPIAQWLEHRPYKAGVDGSSPSGPTHKNIAG